MMSIVFVVFVCNAKIHKIKLKKECLFSFSSLISSFCTSKTLFLTIFKIKIKYFLQYSLKINKFEN